MNIIVAGSRSFSDWQRMDDIILDLGEQGWFGEEFPTLICGCAKGADMWAKFLWEERYRAPVELFPADWNTHGKRAGMIRNLDMANAADKLIAFWDGQSKGTLHMINTMLTLQKPIQVEKYLEWK